VSACVATLHPPQHNIIIVIIIVTNNNNTNNIYLPRFSDGVRRRERSRPLERRCRVP